MSTKLNDTASGITIGVLLFLLAVSSVAIVYLAQVIAEQQVVIHSLMERP